MGKETSIPVTRQRTAQEERRLQAIGMMNCMIGAALGISESFGGSEFSEKSKKLLHESNKLSRLMERELSKSSRLP